MWIVHTEKKNAVRDNERYDEISVDSVDIAVQLPEKHEKIKAKIRMKITLEKCT